MSGYGSEFRVSGEFWDDFQEHELYGHVYKCRHLPVALHAPVRVSSAPPTQELKSLDFMNLGFTIEGLLP